MTDDPQQTLFTLNAIPYIFMAQATGIANLQGVMQTFHLQTQDGAIKLDMNPRLFDGKFPVQHNDGVLVMLTLVKANVADVPSQSTLVLPDKRIVRPS